METVGNFLRRNGRLSQMPGAGFVTIGCLVRGLSFDDIMLGVSALRNQKLANVFYRLKLIEAYGTGILKINESYADYAVKP